MLLTTKLYLPQPQANLVARSRLHTLLDAALTGRLILIAAPAGFGKTTLVTAWLQTLRQEGKESRKQGEWAAPVVAWLSLDEGDNDPIRFVNYLVAALQKVAPTIGGAVQTMLQSPQPPALTTLLTLLINDLSLLSASILLVLDDYHTITTPAIHEAMSFLVEHLPPSLKLLITTRTDPPLTLARWRVRRLLTEIRQRDLRFSEGEATQFLATAVNFPLTTAQVKALETRTEGWVAGLQLAALSLQQHAETGDFVKHFTGSDRFVIDYLGEEVLQRLPAATQQFLLQTAILDRFCAPLCNALTGRSDGQAQLEALQRANLFLLPLDDQRRWFRYHHLFADVLRKQASLLLKAQVNDLHCAAAQWFADQGLPAEAIHHRLLAQDFGAAAQLIEAQIEPLDKRGEQQTGAAWLRQLPEAIIRARPRLVLAQANLHLLGQEYEAAAAWLAGLTGLSEQVGEWTQVATEALIIKARIHTHYKQYGEAIRLGETALAHEEAKNPAQQARLLTALGIAYYYDNRAEAALNAFAAAGALARQAGDLSTALHALRNHALLLSLYGHLRQAIAAYQRTLQLSREHGVETMAVVGWVHSHLAGVLYEHNDLVGMRQHLEMGYALSQLSMTPEARVDNLVLLTMLYHAQGDQPRAEQTIGEAMALVQQHQLATAGASEAIAWQVRIWLTYGHLDVAVRWAAHAGLALTDPITPIREPEYVAWAWVLIAQGQPTAALAILARLLPAVQTQGRAWLQIELLGLQAVALAAAGEQEQALAALQQVLRLAEPEGYIQSLVKIGAPLRRLLHQLQPALTEPHLQHYLAHLLAAFPDQPAVMDEASAAVHTTPPAPMRTPPRQPLSEREVEVLRLVALGLSNNQIAERLIVTVGTVKRHLNNIFGKLGVSSRTQALARAQEEKLL